MWNQKVGADTVPKDAADLKKIITELNDPNNGVWGLGAVVNGTGAVNMGILGYAMMFGAPNVWGLDASGKVVRDRETEQFKAAVGLRARSVDQRADLAGRAQQRRLSARISSARSSPSASKASATRGTTSGCAACNQNPPTNFDIILPFSADANTKVQSYITGGYISTNVMKKASPDRVKELLRIMDYLAKPFGTQEDLLITYGLAPADYTIGSDGNPNLTSDGKARSQYVPWQYLSDRPYATYYAGIPNYAKHVNEVEKVIVDPKIAVADATLGYYSPTGSVSRGQAGGTGLDRRPEQHHGRRATRSAITTSW